METLTKIKLGLGTFGFLFLLFISSMTFTTVERGTYQTHQAAVTGTMSAKTTPGIWCKCFGSIQEWPAAQTFFFTKDSKEGNVEDESIQVQFNDGAKCDISGTMRVELPSNEAELVNLATKLGFKDYKDIEHKLILPAVRKSLVFTANLMSSKESYNEKRLDFNRWAWDQLQNGWYETDTESRKVLDPTSGELVTKSFKVIKLDKNGRPVYVAGNPLMGTGIYLTSFEIKKFDYEENVTNQIAEQQKATMEVATSQAKAKEAEQSALTEVAQGKARVAKAKYAEEEQKVKSIVQANKEKEVAELAAQKELQVAKLGEEAAKHTKQQQILLGQGEGQRKKAVMQADGALDKKLAAWEEVNKTYAQEFSKVKWVPEITMGGSASKNGAADMMNMLTLQSARQLGLDLSIPKGTSASKK